MLFRSQRKVQRFLIERNIIEWISETIETSPSLTNTNMELSFSMETLNESINDSEVFHERCSLILFFILSDALINPLAENHVNKVCSSLLRSIKIYLNSNITIETALTVLILLFQNPFVRSKAKVRFYNYRLWHLYLFAVDF